jgi:hypothetical protein
MQCAALYCLWPVWLYTFPHYLIIGMIVRKKVIEHKMCVLISSTIFVWNISHSKRWVWETEKWTLYHEPTSFYVCYLLILSLHGISDTWINEYGAIVKWHWQGKTEVLREEPVLMPFLSITNPTWTGLGLNPRLQWECGKLPLQPWHGLSLSPYKIPEIC